MKFAKGFYALCFIFGFESKVILVLKSCEILAPVGSYDMLESAVRCGADAVYLGAKEFSARQNAENFNNLELKNAVDYCHIRGVKVYLTLNILIKENELESAFLLAKTAYNLGIDAVIIEDLGLAKILKEKIPELPLHASTQMSVHSPSALKILKEMGFSRVVVAREMSEKDLIKICEFAKKLDIEIEAFVHGALCMSVSGQCQLSAFLGSRSGNRGLCAGPCRLPFKAQKGTGFDLSLKDLSLLDRLYKLKEIGVKSFKIEGRMKRPEYVAAAVTCSRHGLDKGYIDLELADTLRNIFSRQGFTDGYFENTLGREMFGIRTKDDVVSANKAFPLLHELYRSERSSVAVNIKAEISLNKPITIEISDGENKVVVSGDEPQKAQNKSATKEDVIRNLTKLGNTPYYADKVEIDLEEGLFVPASLLNELRREAVVKLDFERSKVNITPSQATFETETSQVAPKGLKTLCRFEKEEQIPDDLTGIDALIFPLEKDINGDYENITKIVEIPRGILSEEKIAKRLDYFKEKGFNIAFCGNLSAVIIAKEKGFIPLADFGLNIFNSYSLKKAEELGCNGATLSYELGIAEGRFGGNIPKGIISYGNVPLMLFKNCPLKNGISCADCDKNGYLTDRLGTKFPVRCRMGYSEMLNSVPIWLGDKQMELSDLDYQVLYFTGETGERVKEVISAYRFKKPCDTKYTRGLYFKGVI